MPKYKRIAKLTEELYNEIKPLTKTARDDRKVMRLFGIKKTTAQKIRNTKNYWEYKNRRKNAKAAKVVDLDYDANLIKQMKQTEQDLEDLMVNCKLEIMEALQDLKIAGTLMWMILLGAMIISLLFCK